MNLQHRIYIDTLMIGLLCACAGFLLGFALAISETVPCFR